MTHPWAFSVACGLTFVAGFGLGWALGWGHGFRYVVDNYDVRNRE